MSQTKRNLSEEIKRLRTSTGLTQEKFGQLFDIPTVNISHWEQGVSSPPIYVLSMMKKILGKD